MQRIEPRRRLQIGRLDPALPRARHAAYQDRCCLGSAEPCEMIAQHGRKACAGTMQHALTAATLRQDVALRRHQPAAKTAGAPVDRDKGGDGGRCSRCQTILLATPSNRSTRSGPSGTPTTATKTGGGRRCTNYQSFGDRNGWSHRGSRCRKLALPKGPLQILDNKGSLHRDFNRMIGPKIDQASFLIHLFHASHQGGIYIDRLLVSTFERSKLHFQPRYFERTSSECTTSLTPGGGSGSGRRKGAGINGLFVGGSAVQFDEVDEHQTVRGLAAVFGFGKNSALIG